MKKLLLLVSVLLALNAKAQTNTNNTAGVIHVWEDFLSSATTNIIIVPYGIVSEDFKKFGGGIALGYELSPNVVPFLRIENYNGDFFMPSGTVQLQVPIHFGSSVIVPLVYSGIAVPLGNHSADPVVGIVGTGAAIRLGRSFDLIGSYEVRSSVGNQICLGIGWKPNGW